MFAEIEVKSDFLTVILKSGGTCTTTCVGCCLISISILYNTKAGLEEDTKKHPNSRFYGNIRHCQFGLTTHIS
jgi:hypothetical protein